MMRSAVGHWLSGPDKNTDSWNYRLYNYKYKYIGAHAPDVAGDYNVMVDLVSV